MILNPRQFSEGYIHVYRSHEDGRELEFIHRTKVEEPPSAMLAFQGKLLVAIGKSLRVYDLGMKQMLRKAQANVSAHLIVSLDVQQNRIVVGDVMQGVTYVAYKPAANRLIPFADDTISRWVTCTTMIDYESMAGGDKFGNLYILRCPSKASDEADGDSSGVHLLHARDYLHGAPNRVDLMAHFYTQDIPTSITKTSLVDADFFQTLETHMRSEDAPLAGRDHLIYRGYYVPVKGVIDGDLCERYALLPNDKKQMIAGELDRSVREIERKISDVRTRSAF
ncbi:unnamed protein product [Parascedosporium putredinis]|uniref:RSE1/DDB1/CPSF1 C-terminal domain-containing protein n=1 Tax=Parascedosporium putredinis TaxID=1442378 RepID=A0A9P1H8K5_9PEZI|nr:unnamed protein product [Parascedosporium putredinis]CAI8000832.1 unnamed protein product [Parascedosporium putredinis]